LTFKPRRRKERGKGKTLPREKRGGKREREQRLGLRDDLVYG